MPFSKYREKEPQTSTSIVAHFSDSGMIKNIDVSTPKIIEATLIVVNCTTKKTFAFESTVKKKDKVKENCCFFIS